jgi:ParB family chromosome partitioning protein
MTGTELHVSEIKVGRRLRAADPDWVTAIAESFRERGQRTPIEVRPEAGGFTLVAGLHRLRAAQALGWETILASVFQGSDLEARLVEIDENLMRRELSELDRAVFLAERRAVWQQIHPHTAKPGRRIRDKSVSNSDAPLEERFSVATARKLGLSARTIDRAIARADIAADVRAQLTGHPVAMKGAQLDVLAGLAQVDQRRVAAALLAEDSPARTVAEALQRLGLAQPRQEQPRDERDYAKLLVLWTGASDAVRANFRAFLAKVAA